MQLNHMIDLDQLSVENIRELIDLANSIRSNPWAYRESCRGKIMATLFYEPSTRTKMSFQTAMFRLGGEVIGFDNPQNTSVSKGESLKDTITVVSGYADLIVMRNPREGAAAAAALYSKSPIINAGDGGHNHPTQTLTDLLTIYREKGRFDHLKIGFCGDLKFGRTVHSLITAMSRYEGVSFVLISPEELRVPDYIRTDVLERNGIPYKETENWSDMPDLDILYMTRVQRERFFNEADYLRLRDVFILTEDKLAGARPDLCIMHPLPRVNEIARAVDADPRACYFKQVLNGKFIRMALILKLLRIG